MRSSWKGKLQGHHLTDATTANFQETKCCLARTNCSGFSLGLNQMLGSYRATAPFAVSGLGFKGNRGRGVYYCAFFGLSLEEAPDIATARLDSVAERLSLSSILAAKRFANSSRFVSTSFPWNSVRLSEADAFIFR